MPPSHQQVFEALLAQAADGGGDATLFGGGAAAHMRCGAAFLLGRLSQGARVDSALAAGCEEVFDLYLRKRAGLAHQPREK